jgi:hypothetical protein
MAIRDVAYKMVADLGFDVSIEGIDIEHPKTLASNR